MGGRPAAAPPLAFVHSSPPRQCPPARKVRSQLQVSAVPREGNNRAAAGATAFNAAGAVACTGPALKGCQRGLAHHYCRLSMIWSTSLRLAPLAKNFAWKKGRRGQAGGDAS